VGRRTLWHKHAHRAMHYSVVSVVWWQCTLVSGWGLRKRRSAPHCGPSWVVGTNWRYFLRT